MFLLASIIFLLDLDLTTMDKVGGRRIVILSLLLWLQAGTDACSCLAGGSKIHLQNIYCSKQYILVGRILNRTTIPAPNDSPFDTERRIVKYSTLVLYSIKGNLRVGSPFDFYTNLDSASCGVYYEIGKITTLVLGKDKKVSLCDNTIRRPSSDAQMAYFFSKRGIYSYRRNCKCQIKDDLFKQPDPVWSCQLPESSSQNCFGSQAICIRNKNGCSWKNEKLCEQKQET